MENIKFNIFNLLGSEIEIYQIDDLSNNTSNIYDVIDNKLNKSYICKIFDILKDDTKKYLGENEFYFFENLVNNFLNIINIPKFYGFIKNDKNEVYGILLEKINNHANIDYSNINYINKIIKNISKLHIHYWNNNDKFILGNTDFIIETRVKGDVIKYFYSIQNIFSIELYNTFNKLINTSIEYSNENKTIIHGSLKIENIILTSENDEIIPYFIDWGLYKLGYGVEDILFLLIFSLDEELFKNNCDELLNYYFNIINETIKYDYSDYINHIKVTLTGFILYAIMGLFIRNHFSKNKNNKLNSYLNNYLYLIDKFV